MQCLKMKNISPSYMHDSIIRRFIVKGLKGKNYSFRRSAWVGLRLAAMGRHRRWVRRGSRGGAAPAGAQRGGRVGGGGGGGATGRSGDDGARPAAGFCEAAAELE
jgi:hypothetical protein